MTQLEHKTGINMVSIWVQVHVEVSPSTLSIATMATATFIKAFINKRSQDLEYTKNRVDEAHLQK